MLKGFIVKRVRAAKVVQKVRNHQVLILDEQEIATQSSGKTVDRLALLANTGGWGRAGPMVDRADPLQGGRVRRF